MPLTGQAKRDYQLRWIENRRLSWIESQGGVCARCGSDDRLEVDHIDRSLKTMEPTSIWSRREEIRERELANCQVLCYSCHLTKTNEEKAPPHGTHGRYTSPNYKCRCDECKEAHRVMAKEWRDAGKKW